MNFILHGLSLAAMGALALSMPRPVAAASAPVALQMLVGSWNCTYKGPKGSNTGTYRISKTNDLWVQGTGHTTAYADRPANDSFFAFGFDPKKQVFVSFGASTMAGDYGISTAKAGASATTMTFATNYPSDPTKEKDVWHFSRTILTIDSTWTEKGKSMTGKATCSPG